MIEVKVHKRLEGVSGEMNLTLDLALPKGKLITFYGPSGAGKTTTLRLLAGLMNPDNGEIKVNGTDWYSSSNKINKKPQERSIGYVFQDYALFPNMTVDQNLQFAATGTSTKSHIEELIEITELGNLRHRKPAQLSGGQKQRVALARALVQHPDFLFLDEPLSALDAGTRNKLQDYILAVHKRYNLTTLLVSHDLGEMLKMSDYMVELANGKVVKQGTPNDLFFKHQLSSKFQFIGEVVHIQPQAILSIVTVLVNNQLVKVVAQPSDLEEIKKGDQVVLASKAFNPVIRKLEL